NPQPLNLKPADNPGLSEVVAGSLVNFEVNVEGVRPPKVLLHYSVDRGNFFAIKEFAPGRHMYDPWQVTTTNVQQSMDYFLIGGDAEPRLYHLQVLPAPTVMSITHDLEFPAYTKVERRDGVEGGNIEAIEGTKVTVHAQTNMPARAATINVANETPAPMEVAKDDPTRLTGQFKVAKSG